MKISKLVFMGTPEFAAMPLQRLIEEGYKPQICITQPDRPKGRKKKLTPPAVKVFAEKAGIKVLQPDNVNSPEIYEELKALEPDLIVTASYGEYIGRKIRKLPAIAAVNIHPSLLPLYRGATPVNSALWHGDEKTGVTIFRLVAAMDAGPVLSQSSYQIQEDDNYTILLDKLFKQGGDDLIKLIRSWEDGNYTEIPQNIENASFCHKLQKSDFAINWNEQAENIYNQIRALAEKPAASTKIKDKIIKIIKSKVVAEDHSSSFGAITDISKEGITVAAGKHKLLIQEVHPAGKKKMSAYAFNLGARLKAGEKFF